MKHRKEEDDLYRKFAKAREEEDRRMKSEIQVGLFLGRRGMLKTRNSFYIIFQDEWERELERLTDRFEREMQMKKKRPDEHKVLTLRLQQERDDLEKHMTLRRDKKKENLTRKMLEHER